MPAEHALTVRVGPRGLNLTPFSRLVSKQSDHEIQYVQLNITLADTQFPLRLAVAAFLRAPWDDGTCPRVAEMIVTAVPVEMQRSSITLTSGQVLFPFTESPYITQDGIILHGRNTYQRAVVYRAIYQSGSLPSPSCTIGGGQVRPPEPGDAFATFPFAQLSTLPAVPAASGSSVLPVPPWLLQSLPVRSQQGHINTAAPLRCPLHGLLIS